MNRAASYVALGILIILLIAKGIIPAFKQLHSDFSNYYVSARIVADNKPLDKLYDNDWFQDQIHSYNIKSLGKFSPFPPLTAWVLIPLTPFPPLAAQRIFTFINIICLLVCAVFICSLTKLKLVNSFLIVFGGGLSVINNVAFGQIYIIITLFILFSYWLHLRHYHVLAGIILGIASMVKYLPVIFLIGFLIVGAMKFQPTSQKAFSKMKEMAVGLAGLATIFVLIVAQYHFFGSAVMNEYFNQALLPHLQGELSGQGLFSFQYQSWDNLFRNLFLYHSTENPFPVFDWPDGVAIGKLVITTVTVGWGLYVMSLMQSRASENLLITSLVVFTLATFVLLPVTATYHFVMLLFPITLILRYDLLKKEWSMAVMLLYVMIGFIPYSLFFSLGKSFSLLFAYPRLWLVCLLYATTTAMMLRQAKISHISNS